MILIKIMAIRKIQEFEFYLSENMNWKLYSNIKAWDIIND
jgi:hypothetical protein